MSCRWVVCIGCYETFYDGLGTDVCSRECKTTVANWRPLNAGLASLADAIEWTEIVGHESDLNRRDHVLKLAGRFYQHAPYLFAHGTRCIPNPKEET